MLWKEVIELNNRANEALSEDNLDEAYLLKLQAVKNALDGFERSKDVTWYNIAQDFYEEAKKINRIRENEETNSSTKNTRKQKKRKRSKRSFQIQPKYKIQDIGGLKKSKRTLIEAIEWPLKYPDVLLKHGLESIKGCLIYGPPGCGKTALVEAVANKLNVSLLMASPKNITSKWFGESEQRVASLFEEARENTPCIIFIDEVDQILPQSTTSSVIPRLLSTFQQEMDGAGTHESDQVVVVMASNEPWKIRTALLRKGRCDKIIYVPPPDPKARRAILKVHSKKSTMIKNKINFTRLVELTAPQNGWYYSGSDLKGICSIAKEIATRTEIERNTPTYLTMEHYLKAIEQVKPQLSPKMIKRFREFTEKYADLTDGQTQYYFAPVTKTP